MGESARRRGVTSGFAARSQSLRSGERQITAVHVPGDFVDLHSMMLKVMDHSVVALGPCKVAFIPHEKIREVTEKSPHLARMQASIAAVLHVKPELVNVKVKSGEGLDAIGREEAIAAQAICMIAPL